MFTLRRYLLESSELQSIFTLIRLRAVGFLTGSLRTFLRLIWNSVVIFGIQLIVDFLFVSQCMSLVRLQFGS
jgi:hypothetical protein